MKVILIGKPSPHGKATVDSGLLLKVKLLNDSLLTVRDDELQKRMENLYIAILNLVDGCESEPLELGDACWRCSGTGRYWGYDPGTKENRYLPCDQCYDDKPAGDKRS